MPDLEELTVLQKLKEGNREAFNEIYRRYSAFIYSRFLQFLKNPELAEELLQDVFMKLWVLHEEIVPERGFTTFLLKIADNLAIDLFRKIVRDAKMRQDMWYHLSLRSTAMQEDFEHLEQRQILDQAIETLPPRQKEIFIQCKLYDKSYKEVADLMGISVSTVSNQLVVAVREVKLYVDKFYSDEKIKALIVCFLLKIFDSM